MGASYYLTCSMRISMAEGVPAQDKIEELVLKKYFKVFYNNRERV